MGLLDALTDPELMAEIEEHSRLVAKLAEQMGVTRDEARRSLFHFETVTTSEGWTLH